MTAIWDRHERKSLDDITGLSRQRRWQLRQKDAGKCLICGKTLKAKDTKTRCRKHADARNKSQQQRRQTKAA